MPDGSIFIPMWEGMSAMQIAACVIVFFSMLFWLWLVPTMILSVIIAAVYRGFFGLPTVTWRGVDDPGQVAELVLKAAAGDLPEEGDESGILRRMR